MGRRTITEVKAAKISKPTGSAIARPASQPAIVKPKSQDFTWSFSKWDTYNQCPAKYKYVNIDRIPTIKGEALQRGIMIHKAAEDYLKGVEKDLPPNLRLYHKEFKYLREVEASPEDEWGFTREWEPLENWFKPGVWVRMKVDCHYPDDNGVMIVIDFKTGKVSGIEQGAAAAKARGELSSYDLQLMLMAIGAFHMYEGVKEVRVYNWYIDHYVHPERVYSIGELPKMKKTWEKLVKPMETATEFRPKPGTYCRYCDMSKERGGPCPVA